MRCSTVSESNISSNIASHLNHVQPLDIDPGLDSCSADQPIFFSPDNEEYNSTEAMNEDAGTWKTIKIDRPTFTDCIRSCCIGASTNSPKPLEKKDISEIAGTRSEILQPLRRGELIRLAVSKYATGAALVFIEPGMLAIFACFDFNFWYYPVP
ncbi:unnamed protein product [Protopolystoma xenopodis]|uniref:Uncharacterized protein n=1 Tax=Protopolystoma xenopodis TaxID=117903 RepID=A0A448WBX5_9PLAT|nr:unnamed protein product [Protopolystoma xenopodis]